MRRWNFRNAVRLTLRILIPLVLIGIAVWAHQHLDLGSRDLLGETRAFLAAQGALGPALFMLILVAGMFVNAPELLLIALGGVIFGKVYGFVYGWVAATIGATLVFFLARYTLRDAVQERVFGRFARLRSLDDRLEHNGFRTVLGLRLLVFVAPPFNWMIATTRVRYTHFLAGSALGVVPGMALTVYFAHEITTLESWRDLLSTQMIVPGLLAVGLVGAAALVARRLRVV